MSSDSPETQNEDLAKDYRRALNAKRRPPQAKRLLTTSLTSNADSSGRLPPLDESGTYSHTTVSVESVPVYREVEEAPITPKIKKMLYRACPEPIRSNIKPPTTKAAWKQFLRIHFPIVYWLLKYTAKFLVGDIISGLTIGVTHIPQGMNLI